MSEQLDVHELAEQLRSSDIQIARKAAEQIVYSDKSAFHPAIFVLVPKLIELLLHEDEHLANAAWAAIQDIADNGDRQQWLPEEKIAADIRQEIVQAAAVFIQNPDALITHPLVEMLHLLALPEDIVPVFSPFRDHQQSYIRMSVQSLLRYCRKR